MIIGLENIRFACSFFDFVVSFPEKNKQNKVFFCFCLLFFFQQTHIQKIYNEIQITDLLI